MGVSTIAFLAALTSAATATAVVSAFQVPSNGMLTLRQHASDMPSRSLCVSSDSCADATPILQASPHSTAVLLSDEDAASFLQQAGGILQTVGTAVGILVLFFLGITVLYAAVVIPAAAKELEKECKELVPGLWEQYEARLKEGETMAQRPDLMQELGAKLQPILEEKLRRMDAGENTADSGGIPTALETTLNPFGNKPVTEEKIDPNTGPPLPTIITSGQWEDDDHDDDDDDDGSSPSKPPASTSTKPPAVKDALIEQKSKEGTESDTTPPKKSG